VRIEDPLTHLWRTVKLVIGFQGTRYEGWQSQRKDKTIQEVFEKILARILKEPTHLAGSSRTDSGVHARGFVAHFKTKSALPDSKIKDALNFYLPKDILVYSARTAADGFHARFSAKSKLYRYDIWVSRTRPLFEAPFVLWYPHPLDVNLMRRALHPLKGRHDFSAFKDSGDIRESYVREIKRFSVKREGRLIRIELEGNGFLRHMVRVIVGTLIEVGRKKIAPRGMEAILQSKDRGRAGPTARALGLTLVRVKY